MKLSLGSLSFVAATNCSEGLCALRRFVRGGFGSASDLLPSQRNGFAMAGLTRQKLERPTAAELSADEAQPAEPGRASTESVAVVPRSPPGQSERARSRSPQFGPSPRRRARRFIPDDAEDVEATIERSSSVRSDEFVLNHLKSTAPRFTPGCCARPCPH